MTIDNEILQDKEVQAVIDQMVRNLGVDPVEAMRATKNPTLTTAALKLTLVENPNSISDRTVKLDDQSSQHLDKAKDKTPEQASQEEIENRRKNLDTYAKLADERGNKDGILNGNEQQDVEKMKEDDRKAIAAIITGGVAVAVLAADEKPGNNLKPSSGLSSILDIIQIA